MSIPEWTVYEVNDENWDEFYSPASHTAAGVVGWYFKALASEDPEGPFDTERGACKARDADLLAYEGMETISNSSGGAPLLCRMCHFIRTRCM